MLPASRRRCLTHFDGSWVFDPDATMPYSGQHPAAARTNPQSQNIDKSPMCRQQTSWKWRWVSHDSACPFEYPTRESICKRLVGKHLLFYGDSLTQQLFVSLASLAGDAAAKWRCELQRSWRSSLRKCRAVEYYLFLVANRAPSRVQHACFFMRLTIAICWCVRQASRL